MRATQEAEQLSEWFGEKKSGRWEELLAKLAEFVALFKSSEQHLERRRQAEVKQLKREAMDAQMAVRKRARSMRADVRPPSSPPQAQAAGRSLEVEVGSPGKTSVLSGMMKELRKRQTTLRSHATLSPRADELPPAAPAQFSSRGTALRGLMQGDLPAAASTAPCLPPPVPSFGLSHSRSDSSTWKAKLRKAVLGKASTPAQASLQAKLRPAASRRYTAV